MPNETSPTPERLTPARCLEMAEDYENAAKWQGAMLEKLYKQWADELRAHAAWLEIAPQWLRTEHHEPYTNQIVLVHGGVAQYRAGVFYTGRECPRYQRAIQWKVTHWMPLPKPPEAR